MCNAITEILSNAVAGARLAAERGCQQLKNQYQAHGARDFVGQQFASCIHPYFCAKGRGLGHAIWTGKLEWIHLEQQT